MKDITSPRLIYAKGVLFLLAGLLASAGLVLQHPTLAIGRGLGRQQPLQRLAVAGLDDVQDLRAAERLFGR